MEDPGQAELLDQTGPASVECIHEDPSRFAGLLREGVLVEARRPYRVGEFLEFILGIERFPGLPGDGAIWLDGMALDDLDRGMVVPGSELAIRGEAVRARRTRRPVGRGNVAAPRCGLYGPGGLGRPNRLNGLARPCEADWACRPGKDGKPFLALVKFSGQASQDVCTRVFGLGTVVRAEAFLDFLLSCDQPFWSGLKELRDGAQGRGSPKIPVHVWAVGGNLIRLLVRPV
jgi:hypothetical protein